MSTFGIVHRFPGGTADQYDASVAEVHPADGLLEGQTYHAAGRTDDGWIVVALWDSRRAGSASATGRCSPASSV